MTEYWYPTAEPQSPSNGIEPSPDATRDADRRKHRRIPMGIGARLWLDVGWRQVICEDLSRGGAGLALFRRELADVITLPRHVGRKKVRLTLQLPQGDLELQGTLVRHSADHVGLRFSGLSTWARETLGALPRN